MQMPSESTMMIMHSNPQGNWRRSAWESSQYRSQVKYQHTARFSSSTRQQQHSKKREFELETTFDFFEVFHRELDEQAGDAVAHQELALRLQLLQLLRLAVGLQLLQLGDALLLVGRGRQSGVHQVRLARVEALVLRLPFVGAIVIYKTWLLKLIGIATK